MSTEENKAIVRHAREEVNKGNLNAFFELVTPDCEILSWDGSVFEKQAFKQYMDEFIRAFLDYHLVIEDLIAEEDKVVARFTESGTMIGNYGGMEPTGKKFTYPAIEIYRLVNGKITGIWMARDILTAMTQTGLIPPLE